MVQHLVNWFMHQTVPFRQGRTKFRLVLPGQRSRTLALHLRLIPIRYQVSSGRIIHIKMLGSKGILTPLIPNCYVLCTLAILKTFVIRSFFFKKWLLTHVFGESRDQKSFCKQTCIGFLTFWPWYRINYNISFAKNLVVSYSFRCILSKFYFTSS